VQANGRQPSARQRAPDGAALHYERHGPEQTTLYRLVQQHAASFIANTEASAGSELPRFIKDEFDAVLDCGILAHSFLRLRCGECGHDKLLAFSCRRRGFCPSCGARRMSQTAAHLVDHGPAAPARGPGARGRARLKPPEPRRPSQTSLARLQPRNADWATLRAGLARRHRMRVNPEIRTSHQGRTGWTSPGRCVDTAGMGT